MKFQHAPAPWPHDEPDPQPELRAGFEALGFRLLGAAVPVRPTDAQVERLARGFVEGDRDVFREWGRRPNQVLSAPDGTAFVRLAWFWSGRYAEVSTVMPDGRLITTMTDWGVDPAWPRQIRRWYASTTDRRAELQLWMSSSSSAEIIDGTAEDAWHAHRAQVASARGEGAAPLGHDGLKDAVALYDAAQASRIRSDRRANLVSALILFPVVLALMLALNLVFRPGVVGGLVVAPTAALVWIVATKHLWLRARHWRWLHSRLRAPVPQRAVSSDAG